MLHQIQEILYILDINFAFRFRCGDLNRTALYQTEAATIIKYHPILFLKLKQFIYITGNLLLLDAKVPQLEAKI